MKSRWEYAAESLRLKSAVFSEQCELDSTKQQDEFNEMLLSADKDTPCSKPGSYDLLPTDKMRSNEDSEI